MLLSGTTHGRFEFAIPIHVWLASEMCRLNLENVAEISTQRQLQSEADPPYAIVMNLEILVNAVVHRANKADGRRLDVAVLVSIFGFVGYVREA